MYIPKYTLDHTRLIVCAKFQFDFVYFPILTSLMWMKINKHSAIMPCNIIKLTKPFCAGRHQEAFVLIWISFCITLRCFDSTVKREPPTGNRNVVFGICSSLLLLYFVGYEQIFSSIYCWCPVRKEFSWSVCGQRCLRSNAFDMPGACFLKPFHHIFIIFWFTGTQLIEFVWFYPTVNREPNSIQSNSYDSWMLDIYVFSLAFASSYTFSSRFHIVDDTSPK